MSYQKGESRDNKKGFDLGKYIIAKLRKGKDNFEMIADPDKAWEAKKIIQNAEKNHKDNEKITPEQLLNMDGIDLGDIFQTFDIFSNIKKAESPTETEIEDAFNTADPQIIAANVLLYGDFAWTKTQRDKWIESKKKQIITILTRNSINPQTKKPHPPATIRESDWKKRMCSIDINRSAEEQVDEIVKKIALVLPIRMETIQMSVKVPASYAAKAYNIVEQIGTELNNPNGNQMVLGWVW